MTLHRILVHVVSETHRHVGQADIVRELIDGAAGLQAVDDNLRIHDSARRAKYLADLERSAREAGGRSTVGRWGEPRLRP